MWDQPDEFRPERFLSGQDQESALDPHKIVFGFGRRICPGRILADNALFINVAQSLAVFDIRKPVVDGKEVDPTVKMTPGIVSHPEPFDTSIKPRSAHHERLIRSLEQTYPWEESDGKILESMKL